VGWLQLFTAHSPPPHTGPTVTMMTRGKPAGGSYRKAQHTWRMQLSATTHMMLSHTRSKTPCVLTTQRPQTRECSSHSRNTEPGTSYTCAHSLQSCHAYQPRMAHETQGWVSREKPSARGTKCHTRTAPGTVPDSKCNSGCSEVRGAWQLPASAHSTAPQSTYSISGNNNWRGPTVPTNGQRGSAVPRKPMPSLRVTLSAQLLRQLHTSANSACTGVREASQSLHPSGGRHCSTYSTQTATPPGSRCFPNFPLCKCTHVTVHTSCELHSTHTQLVREEKDPGRHTAVHGKAAGGN
jgi:hypothetical protein